MDKVLTGMIRVSRADLAFLLVALAVLSSPVFAQEGVPDGEDWLAEIAAAKALCAADPTTVACQIADERALTVYVSALAEAGNSRDRAEYIDLVRPFLSASQPELRTSAVYALAKLGPDASDTPALRGLWLDPAANVRAGAWAAAMASSDPAAAAIGWRIRERPAGSGYGPDPAPFDPALVGVEMPADATFLWLAEARRESGQLQFLTPASPDETVAHFAAATGVSPLPLAEARETIPEAATSLGDFVLPEVYGDPQVVVLGAATADLPMRFAVIYRDSVFGQTGFAIVFADFRRLVPPPIPSPQVTFLPADAPDPDAFEATLIARSGFKPEADPEESDLFMAITAAYGYGAEGYLELYPDGAYADAARAFLAAPRLVLDEERYVDGADIGVGFRNLPPGSSASVEILAVAEGHAYVAGTYINDTNAGQTLIDTYDALTPGVYLLVADVVPGDGSREFSLMRDFSVEAGMAALSLDKTEYAPGEAISVTFSGMPGDSQDYVATAQAGAPNSSYLQFTYLNSARDGVATLTAPTAAGAYELRAFFREDESVLRGSLPFTVVGTAVEPAPGPEPPPSDDARATLALDKSAYAPGETILITYSGMSGDQYDYVATSVAGSDYSSYITFIYLRGSLSGTTTLEAPTDPGDYEIRAFYREDERILRGSVRFAVTPD